MENIPLVKFIKNYIRDPSGLFFGRNLTREFNYDVFSVYFPVKRSCLYSKKLNTLVY